MAIKKVNCEYFDNCVNCNLYKKFLGLFKPTCVELKDKKCPDKLKLKERKSYECKLLCLNERERFPFKKDEIYNAEAVELFGDGTIYDYYVDYYEGNQLKIICVVNDGLFKRYWKVL